MRFEIYATVTPPPGRLTNVKALRVFEGARLHFTDPASSGIITGYQHCCGSGCASGSGWSSLIARNGGAFVDITDLSNDQPYSDCWVRARNGAGNGLAAGVPAFTPKNDVTVSNWQTATGAADTDHNGEYASSFTTPANEGGFQLRLVSVRVRGTTTTSIVVKICDDSSGSPGTACTGLIGPAAPLHASDYNFHRYSRPDLMTLASATRYWIVVSGDLTYSTTTADPPATSGWDIHRETRRRTGGAGAWTSDPSKVMRFEIYATAILTDMKVRLRVFLEGPLR